MTPLSSLSLTFPRKFGYGSWKLWKNREFFFSRWGGGDQFCACGVMRSSFLLVCLSSVWLLRKLSAKERNWDDFFSLLCGFSRGRVSAFVSIHFLLFVLIKLISDRNVILKNASFVCLLFLFSFVFSAAKQRSWFFVTLWWIQLNFDVNGILLLWKFLLERENFYGLLTIEMLLLFWFSGGKKKTIKEI